MQKKKVLLFLAKAFETMEFSVFIDVLGWARNDYGHNLFVDTCGFTDKVISTFNVPVIVDKTIGEIMLTNMTPCNTWWIWGIWFL